MTRKLLAGFIVAIAVLFAVAWEGRSGFILVLLGAIALGAAFRVLQGQRLLTAPRLPPEPQGAFVAGETERALDVTPLAVILVNRRGIVTCANRIARLDFPQMRTGEPLSFSMRNPAILEAVAACQRDQIEQRADLVVRVPAPRVFTVRAIPIDAEADEANVALFLEDTSGTRRLETMRSDFVANASHELRTPLASVIGFIETLQGPARNDVSARERFLAIMETQARRMARLVDDLLSLSGIELREHLEPRDTVEVGSLLRQTVESLAGLAQEREVTLTLDLPEDGLWVTGDRDELLRVFDNLIENAIKYGGTGKRVEVLSGLGKRAGDIRIAVRDFGAGIGAEHLPRLTERFYRVDPTRSRSEGGTGLGLAIVKHILTRHRGKLEIESIPGKGSTFTVSLPKANQSGRHESVTTPS